jgi:hypothetical protein
MAEPLMKAIETGPLPSYLRPISSHTHTICQDVTEEFRCLLLLAATALASALVWLPDRHAHLHLRRSQGLTGDLLCDWLIW